MSFEGKLQTLLKIDAVTSWLVALPGFVDPSGVAIFFGAEEPTFSFVVRVWSGFLFLFGWSSWELAGNVRSQARTLRHLWIQKAITGLSVTIGHLSGEAPPSLMGLNVLTNLAWILPLTYFDFSLRRLRASRV